MIMMVWWTRVQIVVGLSLPPNQSRKSQKQISITGQEKRSSSIHFDKCKLIARLCAAWQKDHHAREREKEKPT